MGQINSADQKYPKKQRLFRCMNKLFQGPDTLRKDSQNQVVALVLNIPIQNQIQFFQLENYKTIISRLDTQCLMTPVEYCLTSQTTCGTIPSIQLIFPPYPFNLQVQCENRTQTQNHFSEVQIFYLMYQIIKASLQFHRQGIKVGDIQPSNVFLHQEGQIKLINLYSFQKENNNYLKSLHYGQNTFLAPQQMQQLRNQVQFPNIDVTKAECFSIGLTIFSSMTLFNCKDFYKDQKFNFNLFDKYVKKFRNYLYYSDRVKNIVLGLIEIDPQIRSSLEDVYYQLKPYQDQIQNLNEFALNQPIGQLFSFNLKRNDYEQQIVKQKQSHEAKPIMPVYSKIKNDNNYLEEQKKVTQQSRISSQNQAILQFYQSTKPSHLVERENDLFSKIDKLLQQSRRRYPS